MHLQKKITIALTFLTCSFCASAQYKFADLDWGTPIDSAKTSLEKKGYVFTTNLSEKFQCKTNDTCVLKFNGPSVKQGRIVFRDNKLSFVGFETDDRASALSALTKKYGPPQHTSPPGIDTSFYSPNLENKGQLYWSDWRGSRLSIRLDGYVSYGGEPEKAPADSSGHKNF